jgi:hypothetical protein
MTVPGPDPSRARAVQTAAQVQRAEKQAGRRLRVGRQRRRLDQAVDLEHGSPADGAVGAREVLSQLLSDARGDSTDQTGGSDRAQDHLSCGRTSLDSGHCSCATVVDPPYARAAARIRPGPHALR